MCERSSLAKYVKRPSPPFPAAKCEGAVKQGNDGRMYRSSRAGDQVAATWKPVGWDVAPSNHTQAVAKALSRAKSAARRKSPGSPKRKSPGSPKRKSPDSPTRKSPLRGGGPYSSRRRNTRGRQVKCTACGNWVIVRSRGYGGRNTGRVSGA